MTNLLIILTVLSSFLANLETKTLQSDFTVTVAEEVNAPLNYPGTITVHGRLFRLSAFDLDAAYDGKTLYMYSAQTDELTLSNPSEQELYEANPFLFAKAIAESCNVTERPLQDGQLTLLTLTPKDASAGIDRFTLKVRNSDLIPLEATIKEGKKLTTLKLNNPVFLTSEPDYLIRPESTTFVNDMRF
ncbi:MAG: outer membrane lipoprotein carrier protein LolA [Paludibacteraceae bacterium]|nr:outer membrane lipoprotein carrier protein LolA [Paludibacteraceae bacterium]